MAFVSPELIPVADARAIVLATVRTLEPERVEIADALGRVLARDVAATGDVPPFACSAMDGYAIKPGPAHRRLAVVGESRAGHPADQALREGEAIRVSTGAALPAGAEAVIRQEDVEADGQEIVTAVEVPPGLNVRPAAEDLRSGALVLEAGRMLGVPELGAAVTAGAGSLSVTRRPTVAVLATGDELRAPGEPLGPGEIHNSNAPMLAALAASSGARPLEPSRLPDDLAATQQGLQAAFERADVVIISGGVSVGPHDHVKPALAALGVRERFWGVALQPGKPTWFGERDGTLVFGLPGNPVSAYVTFVLFARPAIAALQGAAQAPDRALTARLGVAVRRNPAREQAIRVRLEQQNGSATAVPTGPQGSNLITSLLDADALAFIPAGDGELPAGTSVALETLPR
jgi:molybdopterin molybdotransferase